MDQIQQVPVRVYTSDDRIMLAAPMPGLEPSNIAVVVAGTQVTIRGTLRGPRQDERDPLIAEWSIGPYERALTLPQAVSGALTNATYGNGVLVLAMPVLGPDQAADRAEFTLEAIGATHGERVGHVGSAIRPTTTAEHRQAVAQTAQRADDRPDHHLPRTD